MLAPPLVIAEKDLAAAGDPFDGPANPPRRPGDQHMLGVDEIFCTKTAADIGRDEAHKRWLDAQRGGGAIAGGVDALRRDIRGVAPLAGVVEPDDAARLDRVGDDAVVVDAEPHDISGAVE